MKPTSLSIVALLLGAMLQPSPAHACLYAAPEPHLAGYPEHGVGDVPTDVKLIYDRYQGGDGLDVDFELISQAREIVRLSRSEAEDESFVELTPESELLPFTRYVLRSAYGVNGSDARLQLEFTTGAGPVSEAPPAPSVPVKYFTLDGGDSCFEGGPGVCVPAAEGSHGGLVLAITIVDALGRYAGGDVQLTTQQVLRHAPLATGCMSLRYRAANGSYGEASVHCRGDEEPQRLRGFVSCSTEGLLTDADGLVTDDPEPTIPAANASTSASDVELGSVEGGCSVAGRRTSSSLSALLCGACSVWGWRRRARARASRARPRRSP